MPSFAEALFALSTDKLQCLMRLRGVDPRRFSLVPNKRALVQQLASEFTKQTSVSSAIIKCSSRDLRLLQLASVVETSRGFTWSKLIDMAGGKATEAAVISVADHLEQLGLMFRVGPHVFVPDTVRHVTPASLADRYTLARLLNAYDAPAIRTIVYKLGLEKELTTKASNIEAIRTHLLEGMPSLRLSTALTDAELAVIEFLIRNGGSGAPYEVAGAMPDGSTDDFFRYEWQNRWKQGKERNAVDSLMARGVLYVATSGYGYNLFLVIPGDLLAAIIGPRSTSFWTGPVPAPAVLAFAPKQTRRHSTFIRDIVCMLSFFSVQTAARTSTGHIHKASLKAVARMLSIADEQYATFVYAICRQAGLAAPEGERQLYGLTATGSKWLHLNSDAQLGVLFAGWRDGVVWAEMYSEPLMRKSEYRNREVASGVRHLVLQVLAESASADVFTSIDSIASTLMFRFPLLLSEISDGSAAGGVTLAAFVRTFLVEALYWLGVVELQFDMYTPATASGSGKGEPVRLTVTSVSGFRMTPMGATLFQPIGSEVAEEPRESTFVVQANAEVFIPPYLEPWLLYRLLMITDLPAAGVGGATTTLTRESIRRAFDLGDTPEAMLKFLHEYSRTGVPQNVEYLINEVGGKHGHIHVGNALMYLHVNTPLLMQELQARKELKGYFVRALTDTVAILNGEDIEKVLKDLRKAGYLPVSDESGANRPFTAPSAQAPRTQSSSGAVGKVKPKAAASDPYGTVDWERIAREDGAAWQSQASFQPGDVAMPAGANDNPSLIRVMLHNACITRNVVDLVWRAIGQEAVRTLFEPIRMAGNTVSGYSQDEEDMLNLDIEMIRWARLTQDKF